MLDSEKPNLQKSLSEIDASKLKDKKVLIVHAEWHLSLIQSLVSGVFQVFDQLNLTRPDVKKVPGSYELPLQSQRAFESGYDCVIAIGILIKGETMHFEYICDAVSNGLMRVQLDCKKPVIFGVLTCLTQDQAEKRCVGDHNHGIDWGIAACKMMLN